MSWNTFLKVLKQCVTAKKLIIDPADVVLTFCWSPFWIAFYFLFSILLLVLCAQTFYCRDSLLAYLQKNLQCKPFLNYLLKKNVSKMSLSQVSTCLCFSILKDVEVKKTFCSCVSSTCRHPSPSVGTEFVLESVCTTSPKASKNRF